MPRENRVVPVGQEDAARFFLSRIMGVQVQEQRVGKHIGLYLATLMAHYAQISTAGDSADYIPLAPDWNALQDRYLECLNNPERIRVMGQLAGQSLLLAGLFLPQMARRRHIEDCISLGQRMYFKARLSAGQGGIRTMDFVREHYSFLAMVLNQAIQRMEEDRLLIRMLEIELPPES